MAAALRLLQAYTDTVDGASAGSLDQLGQLLHEAAPRSLQAEIVSSSSAGIPIDTGAGAAAAGSSSNDTLDLRIAAIFVIFAGALLFGLIPIYMKYFERQDALFARLLRIFSGGVILALALVHIIPDAIQEVDGLVDYPLGGIAILVGIMILVVIDNSLAAFFTPLESGSPGRHGHGHGHSHGHNHNHGNRAGEHGHTHAPSHESLLKVTSAGELAASVTHSHKQAHGAAVNGHKHTHMDPHKQHADAFQQHQLKQKQQLEQQAQQQQQQQQKQQQQQQQQLDEQEHAQQREEEHTHGHLAHDVEAATASPRDAAALDADLTAHQRHSHHIHAHSGHSHGHEIGVVVPHAHEPHVHEHGEEEAPHTHQCMRSLNAKHWVSSVASGEVTDVRQYVTAYTMELGCIFHSIIIGIGMGVIVNDRHLVATLMIALTVHQGLEGLSLASVLALTPFSRTKRALMLLMYSITTPLGIAVGIAVSSTYDAETRVARGVQGTLNGISGGMLLYIAMYQLIGEELSREDLLVKTGLRLGMYATLMLGSASMCALAVWA